MQTLITHALALLVGLGGGWFGYSKWGAKVKAVESQIKAAV